MSTDTPETPARPETDEQWHAKFLREALERRAAQLRGIASLFERLSAQVDSSTRYSQVAEQAIHELGWGIANLHMEQVVYEAARADVAQAKGE